MDRITMNPAICGGKPCIRNTRIMVKNILGMLAGAYTIEQIIVEYPELTKDDIIASLNYACRVIDEEKVYFREAV